MRGDRAKARSFFITPLSSLHFANRSTVLQLSSSIYGNNANIKLKELPMKIANTETVATPTNNLVPEFYLNGASQADQYGILRLDRGIEAMWSKVTEEKLSELQKTITFGASFENKKGVTNVVAYKTTPEGESFKLGYVSNPHKDLGKLMLKSTVVFNSKAKAVSEDMFSDF